MANWEESKHPRDKSGQFTSKGNKGQGRKKEEKPFNIPTLDESLKRDVESGKITLKDAARELNKAGWYNFVPSEEETKKRLKLDIINDDFDNDFEEEFNENIDIGEIVSDNEYVYFGIDDKDHFIDLLNKRDNVPLDKAKEWVEKNWDQLQEYQNEDEFSENNNESEIDYENIEYPKGTSKEYTMVANKRYQDALPILEKAGIKLEDFGGKASAEGGYEDNSKEIMDKYVFEPFRKKYPNGDNNAWEKEYQSLYDAIESVLDKKYNDWWIKNKEKKNDTNNLLF